MASLFSTIVKHVHRSFSANLLTAVLLTILLILMSDLWTVPSVHAQTEPPAVPAAIIKNDQGGPVAIKGEVSYTNAFFTIGTEAPMVILEDQAGFVDRDQGYILPIESQTIGQITSDFHTSPFSYSISLPINPQASLRDVDNDGEDDTGVMVFSIAYWANVFGDPFLEERDLFGGGWSTTYASTKVSGKADTFREIIGGSLLVYAPDDGQGFPAGFGDDGRLFSVDDPVVGIPQGYTIVNMDSEPFTFDRSRFPNIDLFEPAGREMEDFSALAYDDAFDALVDLLSNEYAFTEYKQLDWDALRATFRGRFEEAAANNDDLAFRRALRDFSFSIPDGHVSGPFVVEDFRFEAGGGLGMAIRELDNGRVITNYIVAGGPADRAGIVEGAEIISMNGSPIDEFIQETVALSAPFSTSHFERLQKLRYAVRSPLGAVVDVTYRNPDAQSPITVSLTSEAETESFNFSSFNTGIDGFQLPVEYTQLDNGYGYAKIYSFSDNKLLTIQLWERLVYTLKNKSVPGLIVDMRQNGGGSAFLADQMAAYFHDEELALASIGFYDEDLDAFYFDPKTINQFYLPSEDLRYAGAVAVLAGPNCNSACEFFVRDMALQDRAAIVGHYPTAGLGGTIDVALMPDDILFQYSEGRVVDLDGEILIEGKGVAPTIRVPVNEETLLGTGDPELEAAIRHLDGLTRIEFIDAGVLKLDRSVTGKLEPNVRVRYTLSLKAGEMVNAYLVDSTGRLDTILRLYDLSEALLASNDDAETHETVNSSIERFEIPTDLTLIVEVATYGDALSGDYILTVEAGEAISDVAPLPVGSASVISDDEGSGTAATNTAVTNTVVTSDEAVEDTSDEAVEDTSDEAVERSANNDTVEGDAISVSTQIAIVRTEGARLSIRSGPGSNFTRIGYVTDGSSHQVLEVSADGDWVQVVLGAFEQNRPGTIPIADRETDGEISGWISIDYVDIDVQD